MVNASLTVSICFKGNEFPKYNFKKSHRSTSLYQRMILHNGKVRYQFVLQCNIFSLKGLKCQNLSALLGSLCSGNLAELCCKRGCCVLETTAPTSHKGQTKHIISASSNSQILSWCMANSTWADFRGLPFREFPNDLSFVCMLPWLATDQCAWGEKIIGAVTQGESFWPEAVVSFTLKAIHINEKKRHAALLCLHT